ncbi:MAG TPA: hypothetical protein VFO24_12725 [Usitatibacter sp.]|nr:hypothetical protein [Usitatibacter sp.]
MSPTGRISVANGLMVAGMLPLATWVAMLVNSLDLLRNGEFGLPELMFAGVAGMGAYLFTLVVSGAAATWAALLLRRGPSVPARRFAKTLIAATAAVLLVPWVVVLVLVVARMVG